MDDDKMLSPDQRILSGIFPDVPEIAVDLCSIISNTFNTCTFRLLLGNEPRPGFPADLLIRLETNESHLAVVADLQRLAHLQIPDLVPATLSTGSTVDADGRQLEYSITPFLDGTTVLEEVWGGLKPSNQLSLMESLYGAMEKLQALPVQGLDVRQVLQQHGKPDSDSPPSRDALVGGPYIGFHSGIKELLEAFVGKRATKLLACQIVDTSDGIAIRSASDEIGAIELTKSDLDDLMNGTVFCHNDLEPRNILVKQASDEDGGRYELAAIIDWEMAGFFPFAYEFGLKDMLLGSSNLWFGWYSLFKKQTAALLPEGERQEKLIKALEIIARSKVSTIPRNVGVRVRAKWIEREKLSISSDVKHGWVRRTALVKCPCLRRRTTRS